MTGGLSLPSLNPLDLFKKPKVPKLPPVPPPPDPVEMPDPEDILTRKRKHQAAVKRRKSGAQSTILSDATETLG